MKEILSVLLVYVFGVLFIFAICSRSEQIVKEDNLVQNYSINCEISNN